MERKARSRNRRKGGERVGKLECRNVDRMLLGGQMTLYDRNRCSIGKGSTQVGG